MSKTGYKQTELGLIPNEWEVKEFGKVFDFIKSESYSRENLCYDYNDECIYNIHYGDIHATYKNQILDFDRDGDIPVLKNEFHDYNFAYLKDGDLIIADVSEDYEGIGECIELKNVKNRKVTGGLHTFVVRDNQNLTTQGYRAYLFKNKYVKLKLKKLATGISVYGFSKSNISKLKIPIPPILEQKKIATILSTWDKAIETTIILIEVKTKLKKGLMHKYFSTDILEKKGIGMKEVRLNVLGYTYNGLTGKNADNFGTGKPYIPYLNIFKNYKIDIKYFDYVQIAEYEQQSKIKYGDFFFTVSSETPDEVGMSSVLLDDIEEAYLNSFCFGFRLYNFKTLLPEYASFYLRSHTFRKEVIKLAQGSTRFNLSKSELTKIKIKIPNLEIQNNVAVLLSSFDEEIEILNKKVEAMIEQKKGLMQKLLTGQIRVNIN